MYATRVKSSRLYRVTELVRQRRADCVFRDEIKEGLWKPEKKPKRLSKKQWKQLESRSKKK